MTDVFMEYLVAKKKDTKDRVLIALVIGAALVISLFLISVILIIGGAVASGGQGNIVSQMMFSIGLLLIFFAWYLVYMFIGTRNVEYEYILTNNDFDIDKVMAKKGRKHLISFDIREAECIAAINDDANNDAYKNKPADVKLFDYSAKNNNGEVYFADVVIEGERNIVLFQPTTKMVEAMWKFNPRAVHKYNF